MYQFEYASQETLNNVLFTKRKTRMREKVYGYGSASHGGFATFEDVCIHLHLKPGQQVLDMGSGNGVQDFYLVQQYGVDVLGIDIAKDMIELAEESLQKQEQSIKDKVKFRLFDFMKEDFATGSFDAVLSRDTFMYIGQKQSLFHKMHSWLKPGGRLVVSDFCMGDETPSKPFQDYVASRSYGLTTIKEYVEIFRAKFVKVESIESKEYFLNILKREMRNVLHCKEAFVKEYSEEEYDAVVSRCGQKIFFAENDELKWAIFHATKI